MNHLLPFGIILGTGILSMISYFIFTELKLKRKLIKIVEEEKESLRIEKEKDRNEAIRRGLESFQKHFRINPNTIDYGKL
ncbi:MAG: hypothetical protein CVV24_01530 [Ignavibacteriae bacterium HGW-Ignavibacteriae-3]|nr:MAG: hypothetical protein CVV24_01530 [Ignavibacteriae bacterium HGW-Ignavibacteriae-3]